MVEKVRNGSGAWKGVSGLTQRGLKGSDLNRSLDMASKKKKIYRRAGIRSTFGGRVRRDANGNIMLDTMTRLSLRLVARTILEHLSLTVL